LTENDATIVPAATLRSSLRIMFVAVDATSRLSFATPLRSSINETI
jgi:hypothetical protein